jgi:hypothetical protein
MKNGGRLFRRPKLTLSCSAKVEEGRITKYKIKIIQWYKNFELIL